MTSEIPPGRWTEPERRRESADDAAARDAEELRQAWAEFCDLWREFTAECRVLLSMVAQAIAARVRLLIERCRGAPRP